MTQQDKETILHTKHKGYITESDSKIIWDNYDTIFGVFPGSRTCTECQQMALKQLIIHINEKQL